MTRILTLFFAFLFSFSALAQQEDEADIKNRTVRAIVQVRRLKQGALLVRLFEREKQIALLQKQGKSASVIQAYKDKIDKQNNEIMEAFKTNFKFCPVYFFYAKDSEHVKNRDFKNVHFIDQSGEDLNKTLTNSYFYTADLSEIRVDTISYVTGYSYNHEKRDGIDYSKGKKSVTNYESIVIRSEEFVDLLTPFPYSTRTYKDLPLFTRSIARTVSKLNLKLERFNRKFSKVEIDPKTNKVINKASKKK